MKQLLIKKAKEVRERAYAPYSHFKVGAALLAESGQIYLGCNIENASYSLTCCAERTAIFNAVSNGETIFQKLVIIGNSDKPISPCGACRQVMSEFFDSDVFIYLLNLSGDVNCVTINELLPDSFKLDEN